jgi:hypothetical protein
MNENHNDVPHGIHFLKSGENTTTKLEIRAK